MGDAIEEPVTLLLTSARKTNPQSPHDFRRGTFSVPQFGHNLFAARIRSCSIGLATYCRPRSAKETCHRFYNKLLSCARPGTRGHIARALAVCRIATSRCLRPATLLVFPSPRLPLFTAYRVIAVGTALTGRPPHRSVREALPHTAPTLSRARKRTLGCGWMMWGRGRCSRTKPCIRDQVQRRLAL